MSKHRTTFCGTLVTVSPMHVGSGDDRNDTAVTGKEGANDHPEVAAIVRDAMNRPYIPATTLKGLLRRLMEEFCPLVTARERLFGVIKTDDHQGHMGALQVRGAEQIGTPPDVCEAPFADQPGVTNIGPGVFIAARTRIDPASGTARDSALFFQEMVAAGTEFSFRCLIETRGTGDEDTSLVEDFIQVLDQLAISDGQAVGKGQADGFGRLRLDNVKITRHTLCKTGRFELTDATNPRQQRQPGSAPVPLVRIMTLLCDGPFAIIDASRKAAREQRADGNKDPQLMAQRLTEQLPLILGSSISGALRARAHWIVAVKRHRRRQLSRDGDVTDGGDNDQVVTSGKDVENLGSVQRLFGVTGFRGLLGIERLTVKEATPWNVTSVKLDRFSGAPVDNALFTTGTFLGVRIELALLLAKRGTVEPNSDDSTLFEALIADIKANGLQLGHGGNKGFGWFKAEGE